MRESSSSDDNSASPQENNTAELPWSELTSHWQRGCALRSDFARRQALLEIDVLVAMALNLTFDELKQIVTKSFYPSFTPVDRIEDYERAFRVFNARLRNSPVTKQYNPTT